MKQSPLPPRLSIASGRLTLASTTARPQLPNSLNGSWVCAPSSVSRRNGRSAPRQRTPILKPMTSSRRSGLQKTRGKRNLRSPDFKRRRLQVPELTRSRTIKLNARLLLPRDFQSIALPALAIHRKDHVMSGNKRKNDTMFRPSDRPLTEYEKEQIALRKNPERLAREKAESKDA